MIAGFDQALAAKAAMSDRFFGRREASLARWFEAGPRLPPRDLLPLNVHAVGVDVRRGRDGAAPTPVVRVHVLRKLSPKEFARAELPHYAIPREVYGVEVEVVETPPLAPAEATDAEAIPPLSVAEAVAPLAPGAKISYTNKLFGTAGAFGLVDAVGVTPHVYALTCRHVVAPEDTAQAGIPVLHPGDPARPATDTTGRIGEVARFTPNHPAASGLRNRADAAAVRLDTNVAFATAVPGSGVVAGLFDWDAALSGSPRADGPFAKFGFRTGLTTGPTAIAFYDAVRLTMGKDRLFIDQIRVERADP